ncbi:MAG: hypothetical protein FK733_04170 [Asgard group archaeon]|nr:hypothetical protein [Asgard group archaeon]
MKLSKYLPIILAFSLFFITICPTDGISRPAYALSATDEFIVSNDYELVLETSQTVGTIEEYFSVWVSPSDCYPVDMGSPPCTGAFGAEYNADSDKDQYDQAFYDSLLTLLIYPGFEEITEEVPGAGIAFLYTPVPGLYTAIAYFGVKTGIFVIVAEYVITLDPSSEDSQLYNPDAQYTKEGITTIITEIGQKIDDNVRLPGFEALIAVGALVSLAAMVNIVKRKKMN